MAQISLRILVTLCIFCSLTTINYAQKTKKIYHPNGNIAFEGKYTVNWSITEPFELITVEASESTVNAKQSDRNLPSMLVYKDIIPDRNFIGKCKFYYSSGKLMAEGNYKDGNKNGVFKLYHPNGKLGAVQYYTKGMATDTWEYWDENGNLLVQCNYKPIPDKMVENIITEFISEEYDKRGIQGMQLFEKVHREWHYLNVFNTSKNPVIEYHHNNIYTFTQILHKDKIKNIGFKHGSYKTWERNQPRLVMNFDNNEPTGIWTIYDNGKKVFEMEIANDSVIKAKDYLNESKNYGTEAYFENKKKEDELKNKLQNLDLAGVGTIEPMAVSVGAPPQNEATTKDSNEIYRSVEQLAKAPYNYTEYISKNIQYPQEAQDNEIEGRVTVQFVVKKDGSISNVDVKRKAHPLLDAEAIRVVKSMPKWEPATQNGKKVNSYYTLPITFKLQ